MVLGPEKPWIQTNMDKRLIAIDGAQVLAYAILDKSVVHAGKSTLHVDGKPLGPVPRLAIGENRAEGNTLLFFCDKDWTALGVTACATLDEAKDRAEAEYRGVAGKWVHLHVPAEEARRYLEEEWPEQIYAFCGKGPDQVEKIFQSAKACICNECVEAFYRERPKS